MKYFIFSVFILLCFVACQKEISFGTGTTTEPIPSSVKCTACSFLPVCDSTSLTYVDSTAAGLDTVKAH